MITLKRSTLHVISIFAGLMILAGISYHFHYRIPWDWTAPGTGKLPQQIVSGFLTEAYDRGRGEVAVRDYFARDSADSAPAALDRRDGEPIDHEVRSVIAQGQTVVVIHRIGPARGEEAMDAIDVFETNRGRIVSRTRYVTRFSE